MFSPVSVSLFVSRITQKTSQPIFTKFDGKVAHAFGSSPNTEHVTLALGKSYIGFVGGNTW